MLKTKSYLATALLAGALSTSIVMDRAMAATGANDGIRAIDGRWDMASGLEDDALDISGVACDPNKVVCVLVSDETRYFRLIRIEKKTLIPEKRTIKLLPDDVDRGKGKKPDESDAEAVDFDDGYFYIAGSYSRSRKSNQERPARAHIYRVRIEADGKGEIAMPERSAPGFREALKALPEFRDREINIEGLAVRNRRIYLGLREPVVKDSASIVEASVDRVFGTSSEKLIVHDVALGTGCGIRDLIKVPDGFLVLSGPEQDILGRAYVHFWAGRGREAPLLGELPKPKASDAKPEALLLLGGDEKEYRVLVFSDGVAGGEPTEYAIMKRSAASATGTNSVLSCAPKPTT